MLLVSFVSAALAAAAPGGGRTPAPQSVELPPPADVGRARPARLREGWVSEDDYPAGALRTGAEGMVLVRYLVGRDGRVEQCAVVRSSGNADLDTVSCAIVSERFRFEPARDREGRRTVETRSQRFLWRMPPVPPPPQPTQ